MTYLSPDCQISVRIASEGEANMLLVRVADYLPRHHVW